MLVCDASFVAVKDWKSMKAAREALQAPCGCRWARPCRFASWLAQVHGQAAAMQPQSVLRTNPAALPAYTGGKVASGAPGKTPVCSLGAVADIGLACLGCPGCTTAQAWWPPSLAHHYNQPAASTEERTGGCPTCTGGASAAWPLPGWPASGRGTPWCPRTGPPAHTPPPPAAAWPACPRPGTAAWGRRGARRSVSRPREGACSGAAQGS